MRLMSREIRDDQQRCCCCRKTAPDERIATLFDQPVARFRRALATRPKVRYRPGHVAQNDIGNYLGLAVETVSRVFTRFQQAGLIPLRKTRSIFLITLNSAALAGGRLD